MSNINQLDGCDSFQSSETDISSLDSMSLPDIDRIVQHNYSQDSSNNDTTLNQSNVSSGSMSSQEPDLNINCIPVIVNQRLNNQQPVDRKISTVQNDVLIKIKNNVMEKTAATLPIVSVINARS